MPVPFFASQESGSSEECVGTLRFGEVARRMSMNGFHRLVRPEAVGFSRSEFRRPGGQPPSPRGFQGIAQVSDDTKHAQRPGVWPPAPSDTEEMPQKTPRRSRVSVLPSDTEVLP